MRLAALEIPEKVGEVVRGKKVYQEWRSCVPTTHVHVVVTQLLSLSLVMTHSRAHTGHTAPKTAKLSAVPTMATCATLDVPSIRLTGGVGGRPYAEYEIVLRDGGCGGG